MSNNTDFHKKPSDKQEQRNWNILLGSEGMPDELPFEHDQLPVESSTELERAGVDEATDACTFLEMQGRNIFVTGDTNGNAEEGELATPR